MNHLFNLNETVYYVDFYRSEILQGVIESVINIKGVIHYTFEKSNLLIVEHNIFPIFNEAREALKDYLLDKLSKLEEPNV